jgi:hypothetical protein
MWGVHILYRASHAVYVREALDLLGHLRLMKHASQRESDDSHGAP